MPRKSAINTTGAEKKPARSASSKRLKIQSAIHKASSSKNRIHVVSHKDGWAVKREGSSKASGVYGGKDVAISKARSLAKKGAAIDVVIHKKDGTIQKWDKVASAIE